MDNKPNLNRDISPRDFREFYWLKKELVNFCKEENLRTTGGKLELASQIELYLITGNKQAISSKPKPIKKSKFDWNNEILTVESEITDNYKSTENVREFFVAQLGKRFKFNVKFMNWMKSNVGKNLNHALEEWQRIDKEKKENKEPKEIAAQFEYNRYLRDFMNNNPKLNRELGIKLWNIKKLIRGNNIYKKTDLAWIKKSEN